MKKSDLIKENGLGIILRYDDGNSDIEVYKGHLLDYRTKNMISLFEYNNDLTHKQYEELDIVGLTDISGVLIWEREEIDWSKVPFGTEVICWNCKEAPRLKGKFLGYYDGDFEREFEKEEEKRFMVFVDTMHVTEWNYCKLAEEPKEEVTSESLYNEYTQHCESYNDVCTGCDYENVSASCIWNWILDNYRATRK